jgi:hypothetical protein
MRARGERAHAAQPAVSELRIGPPGDASEREAERVAAGVPRVGSLGRVPTEGEAAPPTLAAGLAQARSGGEPLPFSARRELEGQLGTSLGGVRLHADAAADHLSREVSATAFTLGEHIFFRAGAYAPQTASGRKLLAHELAHVAQQRAARASRDLDPPGAPAAPLAPEGLGGAVGLIQRKAFEGPQFAGANLVNTNFFAHRFEFLGVENPETGCGPHNRITTDGSKLNNEDSQPGTPKKMNRYRAGFSRGGGLVRDKNQNLDQAATKMHLINHRLEDSPKTQGNRRNIFLGTQRSNNPTHLNQVEQPVIDAVTDHGSQSNKAYQAAMANARKTTNAAGADVLFWDAAKKPDAAVIKAAQLAPVYLLQDQEANGVAAAQANATDRAGWALVVDAGTPAANYRHLWLRYSVSANYGGLYVLVPPYVHNNVTHEENANLANPPGDQASIEKKIKEFLGGWAENAFPADFTCRVSYFSATYKPWAGLYLQEDETHTIDADL